MVTSINYNYLSSTLIFIKIFQKKKDIKIMNIWTVLTLIFSFCMAFSIGANDAANGLGTSYGTKAIPMWFIMGNGALAEFVGAFFCSDKVSATLTQDVIRNINTLEVEIKARMMFAVCLASFAFIMGSSASGMPISGTQSVVGAMIHCDWLRNSALRLPPLTSRVLNAAVTGSDGRSAAGSVVLYTWYRTVTS